MFEMAKNSIALFFKGKLFANPAMVFRQTLIGALIGAAIFVGMVMAGLSIIAAAVIAGFVAGAAQPYLFKNLRYV